MSRPPSKAAQETVDRVRQALGQPTAPQAAVSACPTAGGTTGVRFHDAARVRNLKIWKAVGDITRIGNPFYRLHDGRAGNTTSIDGRTIANFSSYDYLGLNGHPDSLRRSKGSDRPLRHVGLGKPAIGRRKPGASRSRVCLGAPERHRGRHRVRERPRHERVGDRRIAGTGRPDRGGRRHPQQHRRGCQTVGRQANSLPAQRPRRIRACLAAQPRAPSSCLDRRGRTLRHGRRRTGSGWFDQAQAPLQCLAHGRRGARDRRSRPHRAGCRRGAGYRPYGGRDLDGHAQQDAGGRRRLHRRKSRAHRTDQSTRRRGSSTASASRRRWPPRQRLRSTS
jgi:hypothetical protein